MIHAIVYANRDRGFDLYEQTEGFPERLRSKILSVCGDIAGTNPPQPCTALRFAPLEDRYLLSVIFREPQGNADQARAHHMIVSFLLEGDDADKLLSHPFTAVAERAKQLAQRILTVRGCALPGELTALLLNPPSPAPPGRILSPERNLLLLMVMGGFWCSQTPLQHQAYIASDGSDAISHIRDALYLLPPKLRKTLSFHTGILSAPESRDMGLSFCSEETLDRLIAEGYAGGASSNKYWYRCRDNRMSGRITKALLEPAGLLPVADPFYRKLSLALTDWGEVPGFCRASREKDLAAALQAVDQRILDKEIRADRFGEQELKQIAAHKGLPGSAASKKRLKELGLYQTAPIPVPKPEEKAKATAPKKPRSRKKSGSRPLWLPLTGVMVSLAVLLCTILAMLTVQLTETAVVITVTAGALKLLLLAGLLSFSAAALGVFLTLLILKGKK